MGSEFAYEDLASQEVEKYRYRYLRDEPCGEHQCFVIERNPVSADSGYRRQLVWLDRAEYRTVRIEYFDRKDSLLKILTLHDYRKFLDRYWRAHEMYMENRQTGKSTLLKWSDFRFRNGLGDRDFDLNSLRR